MNLMNYQSSMPIQIEILHKLQGWIDKHPDETMIVPNHIAHEIDVSALELVHVMHRLIMHGVVRGSYRIRHGETLLDTDYDSIREIPDEFCDETGQKFSLDGPNIGIIPVYHLKNDRNSDK